MAIIISFGCGVWSTSLEAGRKKFRALMEAGTDYNER